jgi:RNA polymerase sigma-70 factor (ECF subfamily)
MARYDIDRSDALPEAELIARAVARDERAVREIIRRHNRRLFRIARSILKDDAEAEDAVQEAYMHAFSALGGFRGGSALATWLTRIVLNEAMGRLRRRGDVMPPVDDTRPMPADIIPFPLAGKQPLDPERAMAQRQIIDLLEQAIDGLPAEFRIVLVSRVIEGMSTEETADLLDLRPETVKTRLFRARALLRHELSEHVGQLFSDVFPFAGKRCERMTNSVVARLKL